MKKYAVSLVLVLMILGIQSHSQVTFSKAFLDKCTKNELVTTALSSFENIKTEPKSQFPWDLVVKSTAVDLELRYAILAGQEVNPDLETSFKSVLSKIAEEYDEGSVSIKKIAFKAIHADISIFAAFKAGSKLGTSYKLGILFYSRKNKTDILMLTLFNEQKDEILDAIPTNMIVFADINMKLDEAIKETNVNKLKEALEKGADPNYRDNINQTALIRCIPTNGKITDAEYEMVKLLLSKGADPNFTSNLGASPMFPACYYGYTKVVQLMLDYGADPTIITTIGDGATAIQRAEENGFKELTAILKKAAEKADIIPTIDVNTKLTYNVNFSGKKYQFIADLIQTEPEIVFSWKMTLDNRKDKEGTLTISEEAAINATELYNYFENGEITLKDKTSVWVSKQLFKALRTGSPAEMNTGSGPKVFSRKKITPENQIKIKGYARPLNVIYVESEDQSEKLWILNNPKRPVILKMDLGWTIELESIVPAK